MLVTVTGHVSANRATKKSNLFALSIVESVKVKDEYVKYYYTLFLDTEKPRDAMILQQLSETRKGTSVTVVGQCIETVDDRNNINRIISYPSVFNVNKTFDWNNQGEGDVRSEAAPKAATASKVKPKVETPTEAPEDYDPFADNAEGPVVEGDEVKPKAKSVWG